MLGRARGVVGTSLGSGVVGDAAEGLVLTNYHVIGGYVRHLLPPGALAFACTLPDWRLTCAAITQSSACPSQ